MKDPNGRTPNQYTTPLNIASTLRTSRTKKKKPPSTIQPSEGQTWIVEGGRNSDVLDFLTPSAAKHIVSTNPNDLHEIVNDFEVSEDGKLIINEDDDIQPGDRHIEIEGEKVLSEMMANLKSNKKRKFDSTDVNSTQPLQKKRRQQPQQRYRPHSGVQYRAKRAGGDLALPGKLEPYAYVPLDPKNLNKRRRNVAHKPFESIVKGAKRGAQTKPRKHLKRKTK